MHLSIKAMREWTSVFDVFMKSTKHFKISTMQKKRVQPTSKVIIRIIALSDNIKAHTANQATSNTRIVPSKKSSSTPERAG